MTKTKTSAEEYGHCLGCGRYVDATVCACGDSIDHPADGHAPIPDGCKCGDPSHTVLDTLYGLREIVCDLRASNATYKERFDEENT